MIAALALLCLLPFAAAGHEYRSGQIAVDHPWARATSGRTGAVFLQIENTGTALDRLIAAEAPDVAERAELHVHQHDGDVMRMRKVEAIDIAAGATVALMPNHAHVMLVALTRRLVEGDRFTLFLIFEQAGLIEVEVRVGAAGATLSEP
jgi:copper(I)-binding protein